MGVGGGGSASRISWRGKGLMLATTAAEMVDDDLTGSGGAVAVEVAGVCFARRGGFRRMVVTGRGDCRSIELLFRRSLTGQVPAAAK